MVFNLAVFKDRNFAVSSILLCAFGLGLYGMMVIQPIMMEGLLNYPALTTGLMLAPRGIAGMVSMVCVSKLINRIDPRLLTLTGILVCALGLAIGTHYSLQNISPFWLIGPMILQGFGLGMIFVPLSTIAYSTLPNHLRTEAAGLFSLVRTIGGSIGISIAMTLFTRQSQVFWHELGGYINPFNPALYHYLAKTPHASLKAQESLVMLNHLLLQQSQMMSFINVFAAIMWCFILMIPLLLLFKKTNKTSSQQT
jgi:MFS transporter, DHA2 family, multidrug resistance protein